jgi:hypothetical protein
VFLINGAALEAGSLRGRRVPLRVLMDDSLEMILALLRQLEATVLGLKQLRGYVGQGVGQQMVEELIEEGENKLAELKRRLIQ